MVNMTKVDAFMDRIGYPDHLAGTRYLRLATQLYRPGMPLTKELYPAIAHAYNTDPSRVERCIRHATAAAVRRCGSGLYAAFGNTIDPDRGMPTTGEVVARIVRVCGED